MSQGGVDDWDKRASLGVSAPARRSTSSLDFNYGRRKPIRPASDAHHAALDFPVGLRAPLWIILRTEGGRALSKQRKLCAIVFPILFASCSLIYVAFIDKGKQRPSGPLLSRQFEGIWARVDEGPRRWWILGSSVAVEYDAEDGKCSRHTAVILDADHVKLENGGSGALHLQRGDFGTVILDGAGDRATYAMEGRNTICFGNDGKYLDSAPYPRKGGV